MPSLAKELALVTDRLTASKLSESAGSCRVKVDAVAEKLDLILENGEPRSRAVAAAKALSLIFDDQAITPGSALYEAAYKQNWSSTCWLPPACVFKARDAVDVALALKIVTYAQTKFAVRGAGHTTNPGFASIDGSGVLLDISALKTVVLSSTKDVVSVGPGATWDEVYGELEKDELTVVGGRVAGVGVGGLILGGGMSHFSNHWGLVCDHVKNFEVVLADSSIVQANAAENPDLFHVLKGGGTNFGIVTRFDLETNLEYRLWSTVRIYDPKDGEAVADAVVKIQKAMDDDDRIGYYLTVDVSMLVVSLLYLGNESPPPSVFRPILDLQPMSVVMPETVGTQLSLAHAYAAGFAGEMKRGQGTLTVLPDAATYSELQRIIRDVHKDQSFSLQCTFQPLGVAALQRGRERGGNVVGLQPSNQAWLAIVAQWTDATDDSVAQSELHELVTTMESAVKSRGQLLDFHFMNDASAKQSPINGGLDVLNSASRKWDPNGVFQRLQYAGFLVYGDEL